MDQKQLQEKIALYYSRLPPNAQQVFSSMSWMETLKTITIKYGLNENQIETLGTETTLALLGIVGLDEYEQTLNGELGMTSTLIQKMVSEINASILNLIRPDLIEAYDKHVESLVEEKYGGLEKLDERFEKLPKEVQTAIGESDYQQTLYTIANGFKLTVEQMGILEETTNKVLLGIIHPDTYEVELKAKLGLPTEKVTELATDVNEKILKNIREILKSHWSGDNNKNADKVPIPPYAQKKLVVEETIPVVTSELPPTPIPSPKVESDSAIYEKAGIEMISNHAKPQMDEDLNRSILGGKLSSPIVSKPAVDDFSFPNVNIDPVPTPVPTKEAPMPKPHDPYHEEL